MVLSPVLGKLVSKRVVLASASPRRQEILTNVVSAAEPLSFPPFGAGGGPARMSVARGGRRPALLRLLYVFCPWGERCGRPRAYVCGPGRCAAAASACSACFYSQSSQLVTRACVS